MRVWKITLAAVAALSTFAATMAVPAAEAQAAKITWEDCPKTIVRPGAQCGRIDVPKDYSNPTGEKISVGFVQFKAKQTTKDTIFVNPGGPGGSVYQMLGESELIQLPDAFFNHYDVIGVQPRGLPGSTPLDCLDQQVVQNPLDHYFQAGKARRDACQISQPGLADSLTTENTARDWEEVRKALQKERISILGISYGTILGSTYATLFPNQTNRVVLDSGLDAETLWSDIMSKQEAGYRNAAHDFFAWVAKNDDKYHLGTTSYAVYTKWAQRIHDQTGVWPPLAPPAATAADVPVQGAGEAGAAVMNSVEPGRAQAQNLGEQLLTGTPISTSTLYPLTYQMVPIPSAWDKLAAAIVDPQAEAKILGDTNYSEEEIKKLLVASVMQQTIMCNESQTPPNRADYTRYLWNSLVTQDPFIAGSTMIGSGANCEGSPAITKVPQFNGSQLKVRPLQLQGTGDPQTPYGNFWNMHKQMNTHLVTIHGPGHGHFIFGDEKVNKLVLDYFAGTNPSVSELPGFFG